MIVWRLEKKQYVKTALKGIGASKNPGRWNSPGQPVVYCADHPALALLEVMVHLEVDIEDLPPYYLLKIETTDSPAITQDSLPATDVACVAIGSQWLTDNKGLLLKVPSVIVPHCHNVLVNPSHPDINTLRVVGEEKFEFDDRLLG